MQRAPTFLAATVVPPPAPFDPNRMHSVPDGTGSAGLAGSVGPTQPMEFDMHVRPLLLAALITLCPGQRLCFANAQDAQTSPALASAATERNKATARRVYEEGLSQGRFEVPYSPGFVGHGRNATFSHAEGMAEARGWRSAFPDLLVDVDLILAEGDLVSVRWTARGTNTGNGNGLVATGKPVVVSGTTVFRFESGAIAEEWTSGDSLGLLRQLGLFPAGNPGATAAK